MTIRCKFGKPVGVREYIRNYPGVAMAACLSGHLAVRLLLI